jgi:BirA family biotin operon repressor/biotin-[acetyl-CoA-carboxylase] ligase
VSQQEPQRRPLRRPELPAGRLWTAVEVRAETGSTNADLVAAARAGAPEGQVLVAEHQRAGRGRVGRSWTAPPRAGLAVSVLLRPGQPGSGWPAVDPGRWGWLPLLAGVALVESVARVAVVDTALKWPNDLLVRSPAGDAHEYGKCAGILAEVVSGTAGVAAAPADPPAVVLGIGLNVSQRADELPEPPGPGAFPATSLAIAGAASTDRDPLLRALLRALAEWYGRWRAVEGDPHASGLREAYRTHCVTLGREVEVTLPGGAIVAGEASDVDGDGRLIVATGDGTHALAAGYVRHVR